MKNDIFGNVSIVFFCGVHNYKLVTNIKWGYSIVATRHLHTRFCIKLHFFKVLILVCITKESFDRIHVNVENANINGKWQRSLKFVNVHTASCVLDDKIIEQEFGPLKIRLN